MPALSSFIGYRKRNKGKQPVKSPQFNQTQIRFEPFSPSHPYASPILNISERPITPLTPVIQQPVEEQPAPALEERIPLPPVSRTQSESPRVHLNLNSEPMDWFGSSFLKSNLSGLEGGSRGTSSNGAIEDGGMTNHSSAETPAQSNNPPGLGGEGSPQKIQLQSSGGSIVEPMPSLYVPSSVQEHTPQDSESHLSHPGKRQAPAPIRIPEPISKIQIDRTSDDTMKKVSRPNSLDSESEMSAISGTTLARVVLGDSFALSAGRSHYKSGMSMLARADSATLPRENVYLLSPWRERQSGNEGVGDESQPSTSGFQISPRPPIPLDASQVYVPPTTPRNNLTPQNAESKVSSPKARGGRNAHIFDLLPNGIAESQAARSISRISEDSLAPNTPEMTSTPPSQARKWPSNGRGPSPTSPPAQPLPEPPLQPQPAPSSTPVPPSPKAAEQAYQTAGNTSEVEVSPDVRPDSVSPRRTSLSSAPDIDNVLDYYAFIQTPESTPHGYRPAFSPITEESPSQFTPDSMRKRDSQRSLISNLTSSRIRADGSTGKRVLLPIGEQARSPQGSPGPSPASSKSQYSQASASIASLVNADSPPLASRVFNRQRSGSAPSPIKVVRDPNERTLYKISVTPLTADSQTGNKISSPDNAEQTFPETPSAFSPIWSPNAGLPVPLSIPKGTDVKDILSFIPTTPTSTENGGSPLSGNSLSRSYSQRVLMSRAGASARARHSRQASWRGRSKSTASHISSKSLDLTEGRGLAIAPRGRVDDANALQDLERSASTASKATTTASDLLAQGTYSLELPSIEDKSLATEPNEFPTDIVPRDSLLSNDIPSFYDPSTPGSISGPSSRPPSAVLPTEPVSPPTEYVPPALSIQPSSERPNELLPPALVSIDSFNSSTPQPRSGLSTSASTTSLPSSATSYPSSTKGDFTTPVLTETPESLSPSRDGLNALNVNLPVVISPPSSTHEHPRRPIANVHFPFDGIEVSPMGTRFGLPPSYEAVISESHSHSPSAGSLTPSTAGSTVEPSSRPAQHLTWPHAVSHQQSISSLQPPSHFGAINLSREGSGQRRTLVRPPLPSGPRRPSQQSTHTGGTRERDGSISSITSIGIGRRTPGAQLPSPKFQSPPVKWRGYTIDAAKWTFTSVEWRDIIGKSIRRANEASGIRLLKPGSVDRDIPEERERLEMQRVDVKTRYKLACRRRNYCMERLSASLDGTEQEDPMVVKQLLESLKEITIEQDRLAEELHSLDEQIAQVRSLMDVHYGSALAMALRKLYTSWDKQMYVNRVLRDQIMALEAERDEAWKRAEEVAQDYDTLSERFSSEASHEGRSKRTSKVMAQRKSSIRVTKAGLRTSSAMKSQRSSMSSSSHRMSTASVAPLSARTTYSLVDDIPPVPPIPRQQSYRDSRASQSLSLEAFTPTSEMRALTKAQDELYELLGIPVRDRQVRRSRSAIGLPGDSEPVGQSSLLSPKARRRRSSFPSLPRPSSLPGESDLQEVYLSRDADRDAMLAAIDMLAEP